MRRAGQTYGLLFKVLLSLAISQRLVFSSGTLSGVWTPDSFPNPTVDTEKCGRKGVRSWICDPDGVLSYNSANIVEGTLREIAAAAEPFSSSGCSSISPDAVKGYQVAVALMKNMEGHPGDTAEYTAATFAADLFENWGIGSKDCSNGVLLLLSTGDRQIYIKAGAVAAKELTNSQIQDMIAAMRPKLTKGNFDVAIEQGVIDIGLSLAGASIPDEDDGWDWGLILFFSLFAGMAGFAIWQRYKKRRAQQRCRQLLEKLRREQASALATSQFPATSCPICLEDICWAGDAAQPEVPSAPPAPPELRGSEPLMGDPHLESAPLLKRRSSSRSRLEEGVSGEPGPPPEAVQRRDPSQGLRPLVLSCGHSFCESCISRWLDNHNTCPVCRVVLAEESPVPQAAQQQQAYLNTRRLWDRDMYQSEFIFRLGSLQRMYPLIVTLDMLAMWHDQINRGCVVDWPSERYFQMHDDSLRAERAHAGHYGASSGFGGGSAVGGSGAGGSW
eukprot:jgi/Botrbrau1/21257/Bobra.39_2s0049.2